MQSIHKNLYKIIPPIAIVVIAAILAVLSLFFVDPAHANHNYQHTYEQEAARCNQLPGGGPREDCLNDANRERTRAATEEAESNSRNNSNNSSSSNECGGVEISIAVDCRGNNAILSYLGALIRFMAAGIGLIITLMIVVSGVQYITSAGNPEGVAAAKKKLMHAIEALLLFIFAAAIMNFVIPGGIL